MKNTIIWVIALLAIGGGAFWGGIQYSDAKIKGGATGQPGMMGQYRNGQAGGMGAGAGRRGGMMGQAGGGFLNGEIIAKDDKSVTIKLRDGGSKIVFFSGSTAIGKMTDGTAADLVVGKTVSAIGKAGTDGSVTADSIQIRPALPVGMPGTDAKRDAAAPAVK